MNALARSRDYVRGRWGKVAGRLIFMSALYIPLYIATNIVQSLITNIMQSFVFGALVQLAIIALSPVATAYTFVLYKHLRELGPLAPAKNTKVRFILLAILGAVIIPLLIVLLVFAYRSIAPKLQKNNLNHSQNTSYQGDLRCSPTETPSIHAEDSGKEVRFSVTHYNSSTLEKISAKSECVSVAEAAKRLSMPLFFPAYIPEKFIPDNESYANVTIDGIYGNEEVFYYSFSTNENPKHYISIILSKPTQESEFCLETEMKNQDGSKICYSNGTIKKFTMDGESLVLFSGTESNDELKKIFDSLQPIGKK